MIRDSEMQQLVGDHEILETGCPAREVVGERDDSATRA